MFHVGCRGKNIIDLCLPLIKTLHPASLKHCQYNDMVLSLVLWVKVIDMQMASDLDKYVSPWSRGYFKPHLGQHHLIRKSSMDLKTRVAVQFHCSLYLWGLVQLNNLQANRTESARNKPLEIFHVLLFLFQFHQRDLSPSIVISFYFAYLFQVSTQFPL